jgi:hypothetical protein
MKNNLIEPYWNGDLTNTNTSVLLYSFQNSIEPLWNKGVPTKNVA